MDEQIKVVEHLKLIQPIICRMNACSFKIKGFVLSINTILFGFYVKSIDIKFNILVAFLTVLLLFMDMYYLWQERLYRNLYNTIRLNDKTDFRMSIEKEDKKKEKFLKTFFLFLFGFFIVFFYWLI